MSGVLALVGGGEWSPGCTFDRTLLEASGGNEVAVLPTGSAYENPAKLLARAVEWFDGLGATVREVPVLTRSDASAEEHAEVVRAARFVYLAGASAQHLRSVLKDTPLYAALVEAWHGGAVLAGSAAGADVLCDPMVDARGGAFAVGLGLLVGVSVIPACNTWSPEKIHRTVELAPRDLAVVAVPEATAVIRGTDGAWRAAGVGDPVVYRNGKLASLADLPA
ncbi:MAG: Type 1 glutamine amidotransferase-like domain-containing protein [Acidimicrobiales bacterium]|jgi:cyanophycinase|nr:Type 1 glutamine amidotransferase-like domain-containing protein [Acidimicrobiales bacterium]